MKEYQHKFIEFLIESEALCFGEFKLKSGRISPYFFNSAKFNTGERLAKLAKFYAEHLIETIGRECKSVFGPAYKGIPLAVATAIELSSKHQYSIGYTFNRKEAKDHGDRGELVGAQLNPKDSIVIVEDVITAGTTLKEVVPQLRERYQVDIKGVIIALDRTERGSDSTLSAKDEAARDLNIKIFPLVTTPQIISYLENLNTKNDLQQFVPRIREYLETHGAK
jgi:orotate phosphoribosyltransferase